MAEASKVIKVTLQSKNLQCKDLHDYLKTLPIETLDRMYNHPTTCLAVYRYMNCNFTTDTVCYVVT
jgi:transcription initiation factor TFIIH subunit 4